MKYSQKTLLTNITLKKDKNGQDYWIIKTSYKSYLAFSQDESLTPQTLSILTNFSAQIINKEVILTILKQGEKEKVIGIELVK